jgi:hypothetical protein
VSAHPDLRLATGRETTILSPFTLDAAPMERLLLVNFERDPDDVYVGFEPQAFDDDVHGRGLLVIGWRRDGRVDVYHQPQLRLDPGTYDIAGGGLAHMGARSLEGAHFEIGPAGVDAAFAFEDLLGRAVSVRIVERGHTRRRPFGLLAPMGSSATAPSALPLVFLEGFYFVRRARSDVRIVVAGREHRPDVLPVPVDGSRMYFLRYASAPFIVTMNRADDGPLAPVRLDADGVAEDGLAYVVVGHEGAQRIERIRRRAGPRALDLVFDPPFPDLAALAAGAVVEGRFTIDAGATLGTVGGEYLVVCDGTRVTTTVTPSGGWRPPPASLSVGLIYRLVSLFRTWPATYRWTGELDLAADLPHLRSRWERLARG